MITRRFDITKDMISDRLPGLERYQPFRGRIMDHAEVKVSDKALKPPYPESQHPASSSLIGGAMNGQGPDRGSAVTLGPSVSNYLWTG